MKRTIEIEDTRDERIAAAESDLSDWAARQFKECPDNDPGEFEGNKLADEIHEIADSSTPIYSGEIKSWMYLHGDEAREAYRDAGLGNGDEDNHEQVCIYCVIEAALWEHWRTLVEEEQARRADADAAAEEIATDV